jgi:ABC transporter with metal-binding/Fe-S-binding domain ATP-binding protein|tara:strand:+ start:1270 stop:1959 length:690 start_codon:yes stop_codon:yes gene_type:complete
MRLAAFFSGGKDSTFAIYSAKKHGHTVEVLLTLFPKSDESHLLHYPNILQTKIQSQSMQIPQIIDISKDIESNTEELELDNLIKTAKKTYEFDGIVHGGILSEYQKRKFESLCKHNDLKLISPIWQKNPLLYMKELLDNNFEFIISSVSADGLDKSWIGKKISYQEIDELEQLSNKFQFNLNFEGGEAETFVINCPLFKNPIKIVNSNKIWDGVRGRFEIVEAKLENNA